MAFEEYGAKTVSRRINITSDAVSIAVVGQKTKHISITIGTKVLKKFGFVVGERYALYFGTGEDKGRVLLKKSTNGTVLTPYYKKKDEVDNPGLIMRVLKQAKPIEDFCNKVIAREIVHHKWDDTSGGLIVALPEAFFFQGEVNVHSVPPPDPEEAKETIPN